MTGFVVVNFYVESVLGAKPEIRVQVTKAAWVKKALSKLSKVAEVVDNTHEIEEAEVVGENRKQNIISGNEGSKIPHTLSENTCIFGTRPEYLRFFSLKNVSC